jgi:5,5'-dehydrodivanillate O-demethylase
MRRYWHPIAPSAGLLENPVRKIRILGEDLVLFKDRQGQLGLIGDRCVHRAMDLRFGIPEETGLRCPYHGWLYDGSGQILQTPLEPVDSHIKDHVRIKAYGVEEMGGLVWAYLGPEPAPLLPRWDLFVREDGFRQIYTHALPCNWLQVMENRGDLGHGVYLHGRLFQYALERRGRLTGDPNARYNAAMAQQEDRLRRGVHTRYRTIPNEFGFTKASLESDQSEDRPSWRVGMNPVLFPYILHSGHRERVRQVYQIGVPLDDTTTWHISYHCFVFPPGVEVPRQEVVPYVDVPLADERGQYILDYVLGQDMVAWYGQGAVTDRSQEHLGVSDECLVAYRKLLSEQIDLVEEGGEPINVFREVERNVRLEPPVPSEAELRGGFAGRGQFYRANYHRVSEGGWTYLDDDVERYSPDRETLLRLYQQSEEVARASRS